MGSARSLFASYLRIRSLAATSSSSTSASPELAADFLDEPGATLDLGGSESEAGRVRLGGADGLDQVGEVFGERGEGGLEIGAGGGELGRGRS